MSDVPLDELQLLLSECHYALKRKERELQWLRAEITVVERMIAEATKAVAP